MPKHEHSIYDTDPHFSIDPITRVISNESSTKTKVMQFDHNSERFTFEIPRMVEGHDMSECNKIEVHYINKATNADVYPVTDMQISPDSQDVVIFSWLLSQNATKLAGALSFLVRFSCVADDGTIEYAWNTAVFNGIAVSEGMYNTDIVEEEYSDTLAQWKIELERIASEAGTDIDLSTVAPAITTTMIGGDKTLTVSDVSPFEHKCSLRLSSDTYEEGGESNNIYEIPEDLVANGVYRNEPAVWDTVQYTINTTGSIDYSGYVTMGDIGFRIPIDQSKLADGQTYTISIRNNKGRKMVAVNAFTGKDGWVDGSYTEKYDDTISYTFTSGLYEDHMGVDLGFGTDEFEETMSLEGFTLYIQLELGDERTEWAPAGGSVEVKPYIEDFSTVIVSVNGKYYTPTEDGIVTGIDSVSPTMNIITDNEHANIADFTYCVDTKKYISDQVKKNSGSVDQYELVEEITVTEAGNVDKSTTPNGEYYEKLYKNILVTIYNADDKGSVFCYIYRGGALCMITSTFNANEFGTVKTEIIAPNLSEWEVTKRASTGYGSAVNKGCIETSNNVSRVLVNGCTVGTIVKIYGVRA